MKKLDDFIKRNAALLIFLFLLSYVVLVFVIINLIEALPR